MALTTAIVQRLHTHFSTNLICDHRALKNIDKLAWLNIKRNPGLGEDSFYHSSTH